MIFLHLRSSQCEQVCPGPEGKRPWIASSLFFFLHLPLSPTQLAHCCPACCTQEQTHTGKATLHPGQPDPRHLPFWTSSQGTQFFLEPHRVCSLPCPCDVTLKKFRHYEKTSRHASLASSLNLLHSFASDNSHFGPFSFRGWHSKHGCIQCLKSLLWSLYIDIRQDVLKVKKLQSLNWPYQLLCVTWADQFSNLQFSSLSVSFSICKMKGSD